MGFMEAIKAGRRLTPGLPHPNSPGEQALYQNRDLLPGFEFNQWVEVGYVDLVHHASRTVVEVDGYWYHDGAGPEQSAKDKARANALQARGYAVLRFPSERVLSELSRVIHEINAMVADRKAAPLREDDVRLAQQKVRQAEARLAHERDLQTQVHRLSRQFSNTVQDREGPEAGARAAKNLNTELKRLFGPADQRSLAKKQEALDWLTDGWAEYRVKHGIKSADVPAWDAESCEDCRRFTCICARCTRCDEPIDAEMSGTDEDRWPWNEDESWCTGCANEDGTVECDLQCGTTASMDWAAYHGKWFGPGEWTDDTATQPGPMWVCPHCGDKGGENWW